MSEKKQISLSNILKFLLFLSIGAIILYWVYVSQNRAFQEQCRLDGVPPENCSLVGKLISDFKSINYIWIIIMIGCFQMSNVIRSWRWQMIFRPIGYHIRFSNAFWTIMLGYFANLGISRAGEVIRGGSLARYEKIKLDKVLGTIALDRILDVLTMGTVILLAFILQFDEIYGYLSANMRDFNFKAFASGWIFQSFALGVSLLLILIILFQKQIRKSILFFKIKHFIKGIYEGISAIRKIENPLKFIFYSLLIWFFYFLMTYTAFFAFPPTAHLGALVALIVFVFGSFGILIPSPGGMGTYHALVVAALAIYQIKGDDAFSYANIVFFNIQILTTVLFGIMALTFLPATNRHYIPDHLKFPQTAHAKQGND